MGRTIEVTIDMEITGPEDGYCSMREYRGTFKGRNWQGSFSTALGTGDPIIEIGECTYSVAMRSLISAAVAAHEQGRGPVLEDGHAR